MHRPSACITDRSRQTTLRHVAMLTQIGHIGMVHTWRLRIKKLSILLLEIKLKSRLQRLTFEMKRMLTPTKKDRIAYTANQNAWPVLESCVLDSFYTSSNRILFKVAFTFGEKCSGYLPQFSIVTCVGALRHVTTCCLIVQTVGSRGGSRTADRPSIWPTINVVLSWNLKRLCYVSWYCFTITCGIYGYNSVGQNIL